jgi:hypothetical protein
MGYLYSLGEADPNLGDWILRKFDPAWLPSRYEAQFELGAGEYTIRVVLNDGSKVGRAEVPLTIGTDDANSLALGSVFLCNRFRDAHVAAVESGAANFAPQYVPLVSKGVRLTPAGGTNFAPNERLFAYFEINAPERLVGGSPQGIQAHLRVIDAKDGAVLKEFPAVDATTYEQPGSTIIPIAREIPIATLPKGKYRLEVKASDSAGRKTPWRGANFAITDKN